MAGPAGSKGAIAGPAGSVGVALSKGGRFAGAGSNGLSLAEGVIKGLKEVARAAVEEELKARPPLEIINEELIPALDVVGKGFEKGTMFLPQLLMSAEAAKSAFEVIKAHMDSSGQAQESKGRVILATVKDHVLVVGLSALMTTTVPSMEETIRQLREQAPWVKVMVGGAVLTKEYADTIGADRYCRDAMASVDFAGEVMAGGI